MVSPYGAWKRDEDAGDRDDDFEPSVPPGLDTFTSAERALANFLRLEEDLLAAAARTSSPLQDSADDQGELGASMTQHADEPTVSAG